MKRPYRTLVYCKQCGRKVTSYESKKTRTCYTCAKKKHQKWLKEAWKTKKRKNGRFCK